MADASSRPRGSREGALRDERLAGPARVRPAGGGEVVLTARAGRRGGADALAARGPRRRRRARRSSASRPRVGRSQPSGAARPTPRRSRPKRRRRAAACERLTELLTRRGDEPGGAGAGARDARGPRSAARGRARRASPRPRARGGRSGDRRFAVARPVGRPRGRRLRLARAGRGRGHGAGPARASPRRSGSRWPCGPRTRPASQAAPSGLFLRARRATAPLEIAGARRAARLPRARGRPAHRDGRASIFEVRSQRRRAADRQRRRGRVLLAGRAARHRRARVRARRRRRASPSPTSSSRARASRAARCASLRAQGDAALVDGPDGRASASSRGAARPSAAPRCSPPGAPEGHVH